MENAEVGFVLSRPECERGWAVPVCGWQVVRAVGAELERAWVSGRIGVSCYPGTSESHPLVSRRAKRDTQLTSKLVLRQGCQPRLRALGLIVLLQSSWSFNPNTALYFYYVSRLSLHSRLFFMNRPLELKTKQNEITQGQPK